MSTPRDEVRMTIQFLREVADAMRQLAREHDHLLNREMIRATKASIARQQQKAREGAPP